MSVQLLQGDCLDLMKNIPDGSVDMVLSDLPYGTTACKWDICIPIEPLWGQYKRIIKSNGVIALFGSEPFSSYLRMSNIGWFKYDWIWEKESGTGVTHSNNMPLKSHECISVFSGGSIGHKTKIKNRMPYNPQGLVPCDKIQRHGSWGMEGTLERKSQSKSVRVFFENYPKSVLKYKRDSKKFHPTQKPVPLLEYLIRTYTNEGEIVLDNTMGSGSTGVAAVNTGRSFIGMELDPGYFETACKRISEAEEAVKCSNKS